MLSLKPIYFWKYLGLKNHVTPKGIKRQFYLSYEDALWHILSKKRVKKGNTILVPEFFCGDVEQNIQNHGYKVEHYRVSKLLVASEVDLIKQLNKYHPAVVVIFHAVGITNNLLLSKKWIRHLPPSSITIEDSVHRIVDTTTVSLIHPKHLIIDSLRKVMPLQGSGVYASTQFLNFDEPPITQSAIYRLHVTSLWVLMNIFWSAAQVVHGTRVSTIFAKMANIIMLRGYNLIGDSCLPARGSAIFSLVQKFVDSEKISIIKARQVQYYEQKLSNLNPSIFSVPHYNSDERGLLLAYPLIQDIQQADKVLEQIHEKGLMLRFELNDSVWSRKYKIIYLPLGPHLSYSDLDRVIEIISDIS